MRGIVGRSGISMTVLGHSNAVERLRDNIRTVFPDDAFLGSVTPIDGISEKVYDDVLGLDVELYDDQQALYGSLHRRRCSEIPASFINSNPDGIVLLTNEAFVVDTGPGEGLVTANRHSRLVSARHHFPYRFRTAQFR
jgi:hypothetical protein